MDKIRREKDRLYEIACVNQKNYYTCKVGCNDSYFINRDNDVYIREYGFNELPDLKEELYGMWNQDETLQSCIQPVLVAAFKLKPMDKVEELSKELSFSEKLPSYIYNF